MRGEGNFAPFCIPSKIVPLKATKKSIKASRSRRALFVNSETFRSDNPTFWSESTHAARGAEWQCGRFKGLLLFRPPPESSIDNTAGSRGCRSFVRRTPPEEAINNSFILFSSHFPKISQDSFQVGQTIFDFFGYPEVTIKT